MIFFGKKEVHLFQGREIKIIFKNNLKSEQEDFLRKVIFDACSRYKIATFFPEIKFIITSSAKRGGAIEEESFAWVDLNEIVQEKIVVHINAVILFSEHFPYDKRTALIKTILHELTHVWHEYVSKALTENSRIYKRLAKGLLNQLRSELDTLDQEQQDLLSSVRKIIFLIFKLYHEEGLATFCGNYGAGDISMNEENFQSSYANAKAAAAEFRVSWENFLYDFERGKLESSREILKKDLEKAIIGGGLNPYKIGYHLVFAILYLDHNMTEEAIAKLKNFTFIKKYEACMLSKGYKPVVSATSGKGLLDYKKALSQWLATTKEAKLDSRK